MRALLIHKLEGWPSAILIAAVSFAIVFALGR